MALVTFKELQIGQILGPTYGTLVPDQERLAENTDWQLIDFAADLCGKCLVIWHAGDTGQKINSMRHSPQLDQLALFKEIGFGELGRAEAKLFQDFGEPGSIV